MERKQGHINSRGSSRRLLYLLVAMLGIVSGCSAGYRYKVLSVFFDGVPQPVVAAVAAQPSDSLQLVDSTAAAAAAAPAEPKLVVHPPYQERDCAACHDETKATKELKSMPGLCFECHDDFTKTFKVLHGPAAAGQCVTCHNPHMADNKMLLIRSGQDLCLYCHVSADVMRSDAHTDMLDTKCTECHNPHGGEDRYVLR